MELVGTVTLKPGRDRKIKNGYPWVQKGEIAKTDNPTSGQLTTILDADGDFVAIATYNHLARFPVRVLTTKKEPITEEFFTKKIQNSICYRAHLNTQTNAIRQIFSEADQLPGLIADKYDNHLVVQIRTLGMEALKHLWLPALIDLTKAETVLERSDMSGRADEGLPEKKKPLHGKPPQAVEIHENGLKFEVPIWEGLKTGFYLDQRNARLQLRNLARPGQKVLDCFCYSGGFSVSAAKAGATAYGIDTHELALDTARTNARLNSLEIPFVQANVFDYLESGADAFGPYDWIVLDPPAIAKSSDKRDSLKWAVWNLVHKSLPLLKCGGTLIVCSCTHQMTLENLLATCRLAAADRNEQLVLDAITIQDIDHPAPLHFPESLYLKCAWLRKL